MPEKNLEEKIKKVKFDWKEWIPLWGFYQVPRNIWKGKLTTKDNPIRFCATCVYHAITLYYTLKFIRKLF